MTDNLNSTRAATLTADDEERPRPNSRPRHSSSLTRHPICWRFKVLDIRAFRHAGSAIALCGRPGADLLLKTHQVKPRMK